MSQASPEPGPNKLRNVFLLFRALWRLIRGEDQRGRKVRWLIGQLRPYRGRVALMFLGLAFSPPPPGSLPPTWPGERSTRASSPTTPRPWT